MGQLIKIDLGKSSQHFGNPFTDGGPLSSSSGGHESFSFGNNEVGPTDQMLPFMIVYIYGGTYDLIGSGYLLDDATQLKLSDLAVTYELNPATLPFLISTPPPGALPLFATGLGALGLLGWSKKRKIAAARSNI